MDKHREKRARVIKACDSCRKKKIKCYWRPPSCADCIRLGRECTFDRLDPGQEERRQDVGFSPDSVEEKNGDTLASGQNANKTNHMKEANDESDLVERYFREVNTIFPIFDKRSFLQRFNDPTGPWVSDDPAFSVALKAIQACTCQLLSISNLGDSVCYQEKSQSHLDGAINGVSKIILGTPSVLTLQAVLCIITCMQHVHDQKVQMKVLLAAAVGIANTLRLHNLDLITDISVEARAELIRLFWCLYVLDKESSTETSCPTMIDDDDIYTLEPRKFSDDHLGLVVSIDGTLCVNLFTARQRLARIASSSRRGLCTVKARFKTDRQYTETTKSISVSLVKWRHEWFNYGEAAKILQNWPLQIIISIVSLQFKYFLCMIRANPGSPVDASGCGAYVNNTGRTRSNLPSLPLVNAARDTLEVARLLRKAGIAYLCETARCVMPGIAVLFVDYTCRPSADSMQRASDSDLLTSWLLMLGFILNKSPDILLEKDLQDFGVMHSVVVTALRGRSVASDHAKP